MFSCASHASASDERIEAIGLHESATPASKLEGWEPPRKVVVRTWEDSQIDALRRAVPGVEVIEVKTREEALAAVDGAQALIGYCGPDLLDAGADIHWVQIYSAGAEDCTDLERMQSGNYLLTNGQRLASPALAETAITMMLMLVRGMDLYYQNQIEGEWQRDIGQPPGSFMELEGRTALVVGLGGIGSNVAKRAHGLGMRVLATRNSRREGPDYVEYVGLADELIKLTAQADVVINTAPLTDKTRGMFNRTFFQAMKPTAFFVSVGRGESTVTDDLVSALENGEIAGAGLDVMDPEPLPKGHRLWRMPRVIITPHTAGRSDRARDRLFFLVKENLKRYVAGEPMLSVVDVELGY